MGAHPEDEPGGQRWGKVEPALWRRRRSHSPTAPTTCRPHVAAFVPVQINSGARGVGAAGLGWDVPLSYVRGDMSFAGPPSDQGGDGRPIGREQLSLTSPGSQAALGSQGIDDVGSAAPCTRSSSCASRTARGCCSAAGIDLYIHCAGFAVEQPKDLYLGDEFRIEKR